MSRTRTCTNLKRDAHCSTDDIRKQRGQEESGDGMEEREGREKRESPTSVTNQQARENMARPELLQYVKQSDFNMTYQKKISKQRNKSEKKVQCGMCTQIYKTRKDNSNI